MNIAKRFFDWLAKIGEPVAPIEAPKIERHEGWTDRGRDWLEAGCPVGKAFEEWSMEADAPKTCPICGGTAPETRAGGACYICTPPAPQMIFQSNQSDKQPKKS